MDRKEVGITLLAVILALIFGSTEDHDLLVSILFDKLPDLVLDLGFVVHNYTSVLELIWGLRVIVTNEVDHDGIIHTLLSQSLNEVWDCRRE